MSLILFAGGGTGGHLYPALALAAAVRDLSPGTDVHFVGALRGVEARVLPNEKQPHTLLPFEPLRRSRVWENWKLFPAMLRSANGLSALFKRLDPKLVVGTGGYASGPACGWALLRGVPIALQEQNSFPGLTTKVMSRWASQVHLGFPEASQHLKPGARTEITALGNPIRPPDSSIDRVAARAQFGLQPDRTVILVMGGSQGSRAVNNALLDGIAEVGVSAGTELLWATGPNHFDGIQARVAQLPNAGSVKVVAYINEMPKALAAADLAISRAGAMATAELLAWGIPSLLIPLPTAAADHQTHNARALSEAGAGIMLLESELTGARLMSELNRLAGAAELRARMAGAARDRARPNAARDIARKLLTLVPS